MPGDEHDTGTKASTIEPSNVATLENANLRRKKNERYARKVKADMTVTIASSFTPPAA
jgi:hypothetical protein